MTLVRVPVRPLVSLTVIVPKPPPEVMDRVLFVPLEARRGEAGERHQR